MKNMKRSLPKGLKPTMGRSGPDDKGKGTMHTPAMKPKKSGSKKMGC